MHEDAEVGAADALDRRLNAALHSYTVAEPRAGLEERVLAHARVHTTARSRPRFATAFAAAAGLLLLIFLAMHQRSDHPRQHARIGAPAQLAQTAKRPSSSQRAPAGKTRLLHAARRMRPAHHASLPFARSAPSSTERLLLGLSDAQRYALLVQQQKSAEPVSIQPIHLSAIRIAPLSDTPINDTPINP